RKRGFEDEYIIGTQRYIERYIRLISIQAFWGNHSDSKKSLKSRKVDSNWYISLVLGGENVSLGMDLDDLLSEPVVVNARAGVKFQPKARPNGKVKGTVLPTPSRFDSSKDKPVAADARHADISKSVGHSIPLAETVSVNFQLSTVDSSSQPVFQHSVNHTEALFQEVSVSDGDRIFASVDVSPQFGTTGKDVASTDPSFVGVANFSDIDADKQAGFARSGVETADIFSDLESLDDILSQPAMPNGNRMKNFQPKMKVNSQPVNKLPISHPVASEVDLERLASVASNPNASTAPEINSNPDIVEVPQEVLNYGDAATDTHGVSWVDDVRLEREEEAFGGFNSQDTATGNAFLVPCANESLEENLTPTFPSDSSIDSSTMGFSNSVPMDAPPEQVTDELGSFAERSYPKVVTHEELVDLQAGHVISGEEDERFVFAASNENGTVKSSRLQRNEVSPPVAADEMAAETRENQHLLPEPAHNSLVNADSNDEYIRDEEASNSKRTRQNSKKPVSGSEKTGCRRKKADGPDSSDKEPPKKKFSHSTRRNRRKVDKILLETPDHEIDPRKLTLKDLILLAEAKERLLSKDPNAAKNSLPNQRNTQDTPFGEDSFGLRDNSFGLPDDSFGLRDDSSFGYQDDEQAAPSVQPKLNYHTFMKKTSKQSWSQQDTELFYEGIRQFGTDFAMIQQLFPGRTRHQVKLKYKKEERQQPMRLSDALTNPSKRKSKVMAVIEKLKKAAAEAEAEQNYNRDDESIGLMGEEEEVTPDTNEEVSQVTQNKKQDKFEEEEMGEGTMEAEDAATMNHQGYSPVKCHQESEEEDVYDIWSEYKSDI
ncbi:hypothetical protein MKX01_026278, partial [Papaver californicum]